MSASRFRIDQPPLHGLRVLTRKPIGDERGFLERLFCTSDLVEVLNGSSIQQINRTLTSQKGTVRGLHYQRTPHAEKKIISCLRGEVFDVAVDLRRDSDTYLQWHAERLSESNHRMFVIPEGFAHGFQTLTENCELLYFHTQPHAPAFEGGIHAQDPHLSITWPLEISCLSERDRSLPVHDDNNRRTVP
ncbi:MAG: dTDP-4-dehydrorhamnose 3,5-epimerase family protein [Planctomycetota bacterium]